MRDHTGILARVRPVNHRDFLSERLLEDPVHLLFQNGGMPPWSDQMMTKFSEKEKDLLGRYVREGGFLVIEGDPSDPGKRRYISEMADLVCGLMGHEGRISPLPASHPINHSYHHFDGYPERFMDVYEGLDLCTANLRGDTYSGGPMGRYSMENWSPSSGARVTTTGVATQPCNPMNPPMNPIRPPPPPVPCGP